MPRMTAASSRRPEGPRMALGCLCLEASLPESDASFCSNKSRESLWRDDEHRWGSHFPEKGHIY
ncbi:unnamed protein product [Discosporangium mesarthrocarpum]